MRGGALWRRGSTSFAGETETRPIHPTPTGNPKCPSNIRRTLSCETFRVRGEHAFAGNKSKADFPLGAEGVGEVVALGEGVSSLQVRFGSSLLARVGWSLLPSVGAGWGDDGADENPTPDHTQTHPRSARPSPATAPPPLPSSQ